MDEPAFGIQDSLLHPMRHRSLDLSPILSSRFACYCAAAILHVGVLGAVVMMVLAPKQTSAVVVVEEGETTMQISFLPSRPTPVVPKTTPPKERKLDTPKQKKMPRPPLPKPPAKNLLPKNSAPVELAAVKVEPSEKLLVRPPTLTRPVEVPEMPITPPVKSIQAAPLIKRGVRKQAEYLNRPAPKYPRSCNRRGHHGRVVLVIEIFRDGRIGNIRVTNNPECPKLTRAAIRAIRNARFRPATVDGRPVRSERTLTIRFERISR